MSKVTIQNRRDLILATERLAPYLIIKEKIALSLLEQLRREPSFSMVQRTKALKRWRAFEQQKARTELLITSFKPEGVKG